MGLIYKGVFLDIIGIFFLKNVLVLRNKDKIWFGD